VTGLSGAGLHLRNALSEYAARTPFPPAGRSLITCLLAEVLDLVQSETKPPGKSEITYRALCAYLSEHFREPVTRESAAAHLQIHPAHVSRLFRVVGRTNFLAFLLARRLEHALKLMEDPSKSVKEIAMESGFQSADYFREVFRNAMGCSPQVHRNALLRKSGH
jgi:AraC-like DNA-binding protein